MEDYLNLISDMKIDQADPDDEPLSEEELHLSIVNENEWRYLYAVE